MNIKNKPALVLAGTLFSLFVFLSVAAVGGGGGVVIPGGGGGSGSQTPWLTDIDGGNHNLNNVANLLPPYNTNIIGSAVYPTNVDAGVIIDATNRYQLFITNAAYTVTGFRDLIPGTQHIFSQTVSNSGAGQVIVNLPANIFYMGLVSSNAVVIPAGKEGVFSFWIWPNLRTNAVNCVQQ